MTFSLGCAIWAYKPWVGSFYPQGSAASQLLRLYSQRLTAVEGNTTFYAVPSEAMVQRWCQETPPAFQFCLKLPQSVTHQGALLPKQAETQAFLERVRPLGPRLGPMLAQLPPGYGPQYLEDLGEFLTEFPRTEFPLSVEVRHPDWFRSEWRDRLNNLLTDLGVGRALLDSRPIYECDDNPQLRSERRKPNVPLQPVTTAPFSLVRYISHPEPDQNQRYLAEWVAIVSRWRQQGIHMYFFVHCPVEERSPHMAQQFQTLLETAGVDVPPLPWNQLAAPPSQLSLF